MLPPTGLPSKLNCMSMYFPNRLELSFLFVLALPNASKMGLEKINLSLHFSTSPLWSVTSAMYWRTFLEASVFPEPDSPKYLTKINTFKLVFYLNYPRMWKIGVNLVQKRCKRWQYWGRKNILFNYLKLECIVHDFHL